MVVAHFHTTFTWYERYSLPRTNISTTTTTYRNGWWRNKSVAALTGFFLSLSCLSCRCLRPSHRLFPLFLPPDSTKCLDSKRHSLRIYALINQFIALENKQQSWLNGHWWYCEVITCISKRFCQHASLGFMPCMILQRNYQRIIGLRCGMRKMRALITPLWCFLYVSGPADSGHVIQQYPGDSVCTN